MFYCIGIYNKHCLPLQKLKNNKPKKIKNGGKVSLKNAAAIYINYHITAKPKYYKRPTAGYRGYFFGGTVKSPLYESFYLEYEDNILAPQ